MKKIYLFTGLVALHVFSFAQTNTFPSSGSVGIGTTLPQETLHVNGGQMLNGNLTFASDQNAFFIKGPANGGAIRIRSNISSTFDRNIQFGNIDNNGSWNSYMTVEQNGNVGIGTTSPGMWFPSKVLEIKDERPTIKLSPNSDGGIGTISFKGAWTMNSQSVDEFHLNYVSSSTNPRLVLVGYYGDTYNQLLTIKGNGNIGMGTETPTEKLAVNGNIRAKEIKVENANWPDYVFTKDYQLPTLQQTEQHIKEKGHLPGIPSAAEVKANGIDLSDINAKLLQKIEELTLYLIEKEKQINVLNEFKKRIEILEKKEHER